MEIAGWRAAFSHASKIRPAATSTIFCRNRTGGFVLHALHTKWVRVTHHPCSRPVYGLFLPKLTQIWPFLSEVSENLLCPHPLSLRRSLSTVVRSSPPPSLVRLISWTLIMPSAFSYALSEDISVITVPTGDHSGHRDLTATTGRSP